MGKLFKFIDDDGYKTLSQKSFEKWKHFQKRVKCIKRNIITLIKVPGCALLGLVFILSNDWLWFIGFMI